METKGLQKLTDMRSKFDRILSREKVTHDDTTGFNDEEKVEFEKYLNEKLNSSNTTQRDILITRVDSILSITSKNQLWESNHIVITQFIYNYIIEYGAMPTTSRISENTGLSRQTIHKHIKEFRNHSVYLDQLDKYQYMTQKLLAKMFQFAMKGDVKAGKIYLEYMSNISSPPIKNQNNYIQINNRIISQDVIKNLTPEQIISIESVLRETNLLTAKTTEP
jgi:hypothetical protein